MLSETLEFDHIKCFLFLQTRLYPLPLLELSQKE